MTTDKHNNHQCPLEERVRNIEADVREVKKMMAGIYDRFDDLVNTAEATYRNVTYHENGTVPKDENWDFLDEE